MRNHENPSPEINSELDENEIKSQLHEIDGDIFKVSWKEFSPSEDPPQDEAVLFLSGWSAGSAKTLDNLTESFAEHSGKKALLITTNSEKTVQDSLLKEAGAIREMIVQSGLTNITLAAHSEGGTKAVDLISILQEKNPEIGIKGLILLDPVGIYKQGRAELATKFIKDVAVNTPTGVARNFFKRPSLVKESIQAGLDIVSHIAKDIKSSPTGYPNKLKNQISEMAKANPNYQKVNCPVVLIQGENDPVSSHERIIPNKDDPNLLSARRKLLKNTFFPNSPNVDMLVPTKMGHHGLPHFRAEAVAKSSLYLLERYWREKEKLSKK